jgi:hypothetical protein
MRVVRLGHHVGNGQLDLHRPGARLLAARHQLQHRCQVLQDGGGLADDEVAVLEKGRRKGRLAQAAVAQRAQQGRHAAARVLGAPCDVHVSRAGRFERQADEFAATGDRRPVVQFIGHCATVVTLPGGRLPACPEINSQLPNWHARRIKIA